MKSSPSVYTAAGHRERADYLLGIADSGMTFDKRGAQIILTDVERSHYATLAGAHYLAAMASAPAAVAATQ
jgi:hypothetical protein